MSIKQPKNSVQADGVQDIPTQSNGFVFNHTMLRVKNIKKSLEFYTAILGMTVVERRQFPDDKFDLYFLAKLSDTERESLPSNKSLKDFVSSARGILELTYNYGSEDDDSVNYHSGNEAPRGFGHICFSVPSLEDAVAWFDDNKVEFQKRPEEGSMKDIAFIKDPDGYWIEIIEFNSQK